MQPITTYVAVEASSNTPGRTRCATSPQPSRAIPTAVYTGCGGRNRRSSGIAAATVIAGSR